MRKRPVLLMGRVSRDLQARMSSLHSATLSGGYALGLATQGWLSDRLGLRLVPAVAAAMVLAIALVLRQRGAFAAIDTVSKFGGGKIHTTAIEPAEAP